jgi:hypothetical protein
VPSRLPRTDLPDELLARARRVLQAVQGGSIARIGDRVRDPRPEADSQTETVDRTGDETDVEPDPTAAAARALGLEVVEVAVGDLVRRSRVVRPHAVDAAKRRLVRDHADLDRVPVHDIDEAIRVELVLRTNAHRHGWRGIAAACSPEERTVVGLAACAAFGWEAERGLAVACDGDVLGSALHAVLVAATGVPPFLGHLARVAGTDQITLWHCGGAAGAQRPVAVSAPGSAFATAEPAAPRVTLARVGVLRDGRAAIVATAGDLVEGPVAAWRQGASVRVRPDLGAEVLEPLLDELDHGHRMSLVGGDLTELLEAVAAVSGMLVLEP